MLFFELIAPFMALLSVVVAVRLYVMERRARHDPSEHLPHSPARRPQPDQPQVPERVRRPSMMP